MNREQQLEYETQSKTFHSLDDSLRSNILYYAGNVQDWYYEFTKEGKIDKCVTNELGINVTNLKAEIKKVPKDLRKDVVGYVNDRLDTDLKNIVKALKAFIAQPRNKNLYTKETVRFILENYLKNSNKCVEVTGHSLHSIKCMLKNIAYDYGYTSIGLKNGNPMYTEVANEYRNEHLFFNEPMSKKRFIFKFL